VTLFSPEIIGPGPGPSRKNLILHWLGFIIEKIFIKEVIPGASAHINYSQEVLKTRCSGGLGKARIPKALDKAGEDRLGLALPVINPL